PVNLSPISFPTRRSSDLASVETVIHLPVILSTFIQEHPLVDLTLTTGVTKELIELVKHSKINGAFVTKGEWTADTALEKLDVFKEKLVLISAAHIESFEQRSEERRVGK